MPRLPAFAFLFCCQLIVLHCLKASAQSFVRTISTDTESVTVDFQLFPIRSPNFAVLVENDSGVFVPQAARPPQTFLGTVRGQPGAMASGLLKADGTTLLCRISFESGVEWSSTGGVASVRGSTDWKPHWPTNLVPPTKGNSVIFVAEVGVDASYAQYVAAGSNVDSTIEMVEFSIMAANVPFLRDASILHKLGKLVIRASQSRDPYPTEDTNILLTTVRSQWNDVLPPVVGRTHHLGLVARPGAGGGLAWVSQVNTSYAYSANGADPNGDFSVIWRHEAGHNWGSSHYEGGGQPEGPTIMSDNSLSRFSSSELDKILLYKSSVSYLANTTLVIQRPPRANMDTAVVLCKCPSYLNVLANDLDANIIGLKLASVQNPSVMGSTVQVSGNQLLYTPSTAAVLSIDYFSYSIQNVDGRTSTGYVIIRPDALIAWWKMEETSGLTVQDSSGNAATGSITGSATWDQGSGLAFQGAGKVAFDTKPSLRGTTSFSISVWVRVPADATSRAVIIQQRSPPTNTTDGFNGEYQLYLNNGRVSLMLFGDGAYQFDFSTSVAINDGQWHHIVATRDQSEGRIYLDGKLSASATGQVKNLDGEIPVFMGWDARAGTSFFTGSIMATRIYRRALSLDEISYLSTRPEALVGWWKLDERSGLLAHDSSTNLATGTITGSTTWDLDGGLVFGGSGKVSFGTRPSLRGKISFSIHVWAKVPASATSKAVILQQRSPPSSTTNGYNGEYQLYLANGKPSLMVFGDSALQFDFSASDAINDGQWHHIVAIRDQSEGHIYVDGKLSSSASGQVKNLDGNIPVFMGWDSRDNISFLSGSLRGVKIYNQVVSANILDHSNTMLLAKDGFNNATFVKVLEDVLKVA